VKLGVCLYALPTACLLFGIYSVARERLVPFNADFDRASWRLTGDEPAYLLVAQSIASGHGENVRHAHETRTYTNFQNRPIIGDNQWNWQNYKTLGVTHIINRKKAWGDKQVIQRPPLIALFSAPFSLRKTNVRWSILLVQGIAIALSAALLLICAGLKNHGQYRLASLACLSLMGGLPIAYYTAQIFPEVLMGTLLALSLLMARKENSYLRWGAYVLMCISLWGSARVLVGVGLVTLIYMWRDIRDRDFIGVAILILCMLSYFGYNLWLWGHFIPPNPHQSCHLSVGVLPKGLMINFFGNSIGLFFLNPAAWVALVCLGLTVYFHRQDRGAWPSLVMFLGIVFVVGASPNFRAGTCPAGRYQVVQSFVLLIPLLIFISREKTGSIWAMRMSSALYMLGAAALLISWRVILDPRSWYQKYHPLFHIQRLQPLYDLLPNFSGAWIGRIFIWVIIFFSAIFLYDIWRHLRVAQIGTTLHCWLRRLRADPER
jgi:hypothetical protein